MTTAARPTSEASCRYVQENGLAVLVDPDVAAWLPRVWLVTAQYGRYVAYKRNFKTIYLHRAIMECPDGMVVDHINGDTRDNRRANLRICESIPLLKETAEEIMMRHKGDFSPTNIKSTKST